VGGTFRAIEAGALAVVRRPHGINHEEFEAGSRELIQTVKLMSEVRVVRRIPRVSKVNVPARPVLSPPLQRTSGIQAIAIGASTGGPPVLKDILSSLPQGFPVPVLIVQHIAHGFVKGFAEWLSGTSRFPVSVASQGERLSPGHGYIAPDDFHMGLGTGPNIVLSDHAPENHLRPSVSYLFRSVAQVLGPASVGVLLTGMGRDGAEELKVMKEKGAITIAQDEDSSVVHGMPGEAIKLGAATYILSPEGITAMLVELVKK
jgi:two-component system chemotaxis response regulator CheB